MNQYPVWKYLLILVVMVVGGLYALPNLYGEDPAVQISATRAVTVNEATVGTAKALLDQAKLSYLSAQLSPTGVLVRFNNTETQIKAKDALADGLGKDYVVALNLAPQTPSWLLAIHALPMYLGLDLRGGVHFLMEVDTNAALGQALERYRGDFRGLFRQEKVRYVAIERGGQSQPSGGYVVITFRDAADRAAARKLVAKDFPNLDLRDEGSGEELSLIAEPTKRDVVDIKKNAVQQNIITLRNRVNELGVAEPIVQQQGESRIVVQLPGVQDTARAKEILGATATLEFRLADEEHNVQEALAGRVPVGARLYKERNGNPILLKSQVMLTGDYITDAASGIDQQSGGPAVFITLDGKGARIFTNATKDNVGKLMAVVFIENKPFTSVVDGKQVSTKQRVEEVINVARIRERLGKRFQITGLDNSKEARDLSLLLRAGALAAPVDIVEERTVGPSLGQDNISQGLRSTVIGFLAVAVVMLLWYKAFGIFANIALALNVVLIVALLSMLQATLTLPGIAGIVLTVGMAVDANVLIFERIREELRSGMTPQGAITAGFERAWETIVDSNITTLIAGITLFLFGTGPIKGFAVVLCLGILTSMFTAVMVTRGVIYFVYGGKRRITKLSI
ncbi:MAG: protein translocase subunit SecD [Gammaproteobacteria bacterium]|nr:protein translocase subunit SecD [Gammaproteobacteria bacterium]